MIDRRRKARVASHLVVLFAVVAAIVAGTVSPLSVSALGPPAFAIKGDSVGPVTVLMNSLVPISVAGLTPSADFQVIAYTDANCSLTPSTGGLTANSNGEWNGNLTFLAVSVISYEVVDAVNGTSNCITVNVVAFLPPVFSVNGDPVSPVTVGVGNNVTLSVAGLTPSTNFTLHLYYNENCTASRAYYPALANGAGEYSGGVSFPVVGSYFYQATDAVRGDSNCIRVNAIAVVPPVFSVDGDSVGPVDVVAGQYVTLRVAGLTPATDFTLTVYSDANCSVVVTAGTYPASDSGAYTGAVQYPAAASFSYQAIDSVHGASNCVAVIVTDAPAPSPTAVPSETPSPTVEPTTTPEPTAVTNPIPDGTVSVTGDPRFPISGQVSIPGFSGLTFSLNAQPSNGNVTVQADGTFTYSAASYLATFDSFTVLATSGNGETAIVTVNVTLVIDPSVPTYGEVGDGGTGNGGEVYDPRNTTRPSPTAVPEDDEDGSGVEAR